MKVEEAKKLGFTPQGIKGKKRKLATYAYICLTAFWTFHQKIKHKSNIHNITYLLSPIRARWHVRHQQESATALGLQPIW